MPDTAEIIKYLISYFARENKRLLVDLVPETLIVDLAPQRNFTQLADSLNSLAMLRRLRVSVEPVVISESMTIRELAAWIASHAQPSEDSATKLLLGEDDPDVNSEYTVWYGTNRRPAAGAEGFSAERDDRVHFGRCTVFVPKSHKIGSLGSPWWRRIFTGVDDRLRLVSTVRLAREDCWREMGSKFQNLESNEGVIFLHGYNVSFEEAALRAAQIGFDLSVRGPMAFFSWPSQGTLTGYLVDAATVQVSEDAITEFISEFVNNSGASRVHIIAHSMGNRALLESIDQISGRVRRQNGKIFGQVILAAADVDADRFRQRCHGYKPISDRTTLYINHRDRALGAARWLQHYPRVGLYPPVFVAPDIDTINVTSVDLTRLGHSYIVAARDVLRDMHELITQGTPPDKRFAARSTSTSEGHRFWKIGP